MPTQSSTSCASDCALVDVVQVVRADERQADLRAPGAGAARAADAAPAGRGPGPRGRSCPGRRCRRSEPARLRARSQSSTSSARGISPFRQAESPIRPSRVLGEVVAVDARLVVVAVEVGVGDDPAQVAVAGPVLGEQDEVIGLRVGLALAIGHRAAGDVGLDPDDGLDLALLAGLVEGDRAVEGAVVGEGEAVEALRAGLRDEVVDAPEAVEEAELRVDVEVGEVIRSDRHGRLMVTAAALIGPAPPTAGAMTLGRDVRCVASPTPNEIEPMPPASARAARPRPRRRRSTRWQRADRAWVPLCQHA